MVVILCIDDYGGMMFNNRRQSRDQAIIDDIMKTANHPIRMSEYSAKMFPQSDMIEVCQNGEVLSGAKETDICFVEDEDLTWYSDMIDVVVIYEWNRHYPADFHMTMDLNGWAMKDSKEFAGTSHEKLSKEIYIYEKKGNY